MKRAVGYTLAGLISAAFLSGMAALGWAIGTVRRDEMERRTR